MMRLVGLSVLASVLVGCGPEEGTPTQTGDTGSGTGAADAATESDSSDSGPMGPVSPQCSDVTFAESLQAWTALVAEQGDTYYVRAEERDTGDFGEPLDAGCIRTYTLQVVDGVPSTLSLATEPFGTQPTCPEGWVEEGTALGSHDAPLQPWTMEMHYEACEQDVLSQDPDEASLTMCTFESGVLAHCSYFPTNCADGCSTGPEGYESGIDFSEFGFGLAPS